PSLKELLNMLSEAHVQGQLDLATEFKRQVIKHPDLAIHLIGAWIETRIVRQRHSAASQWKSLFGTASEVFSEAVRVEHEEGGRAPLECLDEVCSFMDSSVQYVQEEIRQLSLDDTETKSDLVHVSLSLHELLADIAGSLPLTAIENFDQMPELGRLSMRLLIVETPDHGFIDELSAEFCELLVSLRVNAAKKRLFECYRSTQADKSLRTPPAALKAWLALHQPVQPSWKETIYILFGKSSPSPKEVGELLRATPQLELALGAAIPYMEESWGRKLQYQTKRWQVFAELAKRSDVGEEHTVQAISDALTRTDSTVVWGGIQDLAMTKALYRSDHPAIRSHLKRLLFRKQLQVPEKAQGEIPLVEYIGAGSTYIRLSKRLVDALELFEEMRNHDTHESRRGVIALAKAVVQPAFESGEYDAGDGKSYLDWSYRLAEDWFTYLDKRYDQTPDVQRKKFEEQAKLDSSWLVEVWLAAAAALRASGSDYGKELAEERLVASDTERARSFYKNVLIGIEASKG
ncbi:MAG: hypothetical protein KDB07_07930, partial [Planctomycetes bacterium]|nr:hypothetical protein [Planctomycetota bacterium]